MASDTAESRLFVAVSVPDSLKDVLSALPETMLDYKRITHPDDFHITLKFLGMVEDKEIEGIARSLERVRKPQPFNVAVSGLGFFEKKDQVIFYAAVESVRKISILQQEVVSCLEYQGFAPENKLFTPHVTIARLRNMRNLDSYINRYGKALRAEWKVDGFHLMRSADKEAGRKRYEILETYALRPY